MKVIIDISEEVYEILQHQSISIHSEGYILENAVLNGTVIPTEDKFLDAVCEVLRSKL